MGARQVGTAGSVFSHGNGVRLGSVEILMKNWGLPIMRRTVLVCSLCVLFIVLMGLLFHELGHARNFRGRD